jgi:hypothetical protein
LAWKKRRHYLAQGRVVGSMEEVVPTKVGGFRGKNSSNGVRDRHRYDPVHCVPHWRIDMLIGIA